MAPSKQQRLSLPLLLGAFLFAGALTALWTYSTDALQQAIPGTARPVGARPGSPAPTSSTSRTSVTTDVDLARPTQPAEAPPADSPATPAQPEATHATVRVRGYVADARGPVAGEFEVAVYTLFSKAHASVPQQFVHRGALARAQRERVCMLPGIGLVSLLARGRSAPNGQFQLDVDLGEVTQNRLLAVAVASSTDRALLGAANRIHRADRAELDFEAVTLDRVIRIRVGVTDHGRPVPNARVSFELDEGYGQLREHRTDERGQATFAYPNTVFGFGIVEVLVEAEGFACWSDTLDTSRLKELAVKLVAGRPVHGRVSGPTGAPLPQVSVRAQPTGKATAHVANVETVSDTQGRFVLQGVAEGQTYAVHTHERSGEFVGTATQLAPPFADLELRMVRAGRIGITVETDLATFDYDALDFLVEHLQEGGWVPDFAFRDRFDHADMHGEEPVRPSPTSRYFEYRWVTPGEYRVRSVGGRLRTTARLTVRAGETAVATVHATPLHTVRLLFPEVQGEFVDVVYALSEGETEVDAMVRGGVLVLTPPPLARACTVKTWDHKPVHVELPAGVDELGPFRFEPRTEDD